MTDPYSDILLILSDGDVSKIRQIEITSVKIARQFLYQKRVKALNSLRSMLKEPKK